jgi:hypothetical protein
MPKDREGHHEGGSPVDTTRANSSPEELARKDPAKGDDKDNSGCKDKKS